MWNQSGKDGSCPVCGRTKKDCTWTTDLEIVHCHTKANPGSSVPQPPDETAGYKWNGKFNDDGVQPRAEYLKVREHWQKPARASARREHIYYDAQDNPVYKVVRIMPEGKTYQENIGGIDNKDIPVYRLPQVRQAIERGEPVYLVEGEAAAEALAQIGLCGTTFCGGAGKMRRYHASRQSQLEGAKLVLCPDRDKKGLEHMQDAAKDFPGASWMMAQPDSWEWKELPATGGYDVADWIAEGADREIIQLAVKEPQSEELAVRDVKAESDEGFNGAVSAMESIIKDHGLLTARYDWEMYRLGQGLKMPSKVLEQIYLKGNSEAYQMAPKSTKQVQEDVGDASAQWLVSDLLPVGSAVLFGAHGGMGKTILAYQLAKAVATGDDFNTRFRTHRQRDVLILQSDESKQDMARKIKQMGLALDNVKVDFEWDFLKMRQLESYIDQHRPGLVIVDSYFSSAAPTQVEEKETRYALPMKEMAKMASKYGTTFFVLHHMSKKGDFRGTSALKAACSETWLLRKGEQELDKVKLGYTERVLLNDKSRAGVNGRYVINLETDTLHYEYVDDLAKTEEGYDSKPASIGDKLLAVFEANPGSAFQIADFCQMQLLAGAEYRSIQSALRRLVDRGRLARKDVMKPNTNGPTSYYGYPGKNSPLALMDSSGFILDGGKDEKVNPSPSTLCTGQDSPMDSGMDSHGFTPEKESIPQGQISMDMDSPPKKTPPLNPSPLHDSNPGSESDTAHPDQSGHGFMNPSESILNPSLNPSNNVDRERVSGGMDSQPAINTPLSKFFKIVEGPSPLQERKQNSKKRRTPQHNPVGDYTGPQEGDEVVFTSQHLSPAQLSRIKGSGSEYPWGNKGTVLSHDWDYRKNRYMLTISSGDKTFVVDNLAAVEKI